MNKHNAQDYLPLVQALAEGKTIQYFSPAENEWIDAGEGGLTFEFHPNRYRIKPEPRKAWVWWPPAGSPISEPLITYSEMRAINWRLEDGGHITEVTE